MVADQPLDDSTLASAVGYPVVEVAEALDDPGGGVRRVRPRLRAAQRRGRLALLHPRGLRARRGEVRARGPAGAADPGRARDARRGRLQAAGQPQPRLRHPWRERRRRDAHAAQPRPGRGGRHRPGDRRAPLPHLELLPRAHRGHLDRRAARAGAVPARRRGLRRRGRDGRGGADGRRSDGSPTAAESATAPPETNEGDRDRRRGAGPAAEAAGPVGGRQPAQVRGADARRRGRGRRRGGHPARHQGRPADRPHPRQGPAAAADHRPRLPGAEQAARASSPRCRTPRDAPR